MGDKWAKNGGKWVEWAKNGQKRTENGEKGAKMDGNGRKWAIFGKNRQFLEANSHTDEHPVPRVRDGTGGRGGRRWCGGNKRKNEMFYGAVPCLGPGFVVSCQLTLKMAKKRPKSPKRLKNG